jgi:mannosyltransferase
VTRRRPDLWLLALLALGLALRLWRLDHWSFWGDEIATLHFARMPLAEIWGADTHPPLYYALIHLWRLLGEQETTLRLSSALVSAATVGLAYGCGRRLGGRAVGRWAALLQALSPMALTYAQELRMYALLEFAAALALLGLLTLFQRPAWAAGPWQGAGGPRPAWLAFGLGALLAVYTHNTGPLLPVAATAAALACWWRLPERRILARRWLLVTGAVVLLWLVYLPWFLGQAGWVASNFWVRAPGLGKLLDELAWIHLGIAARTTAPWIAWLALAALLPILALGALRLARRPRLLALLAALALLPPALELLAGLVKPIFLARTLIWTALPTLLLLALGLEHLRQGRPRPPRRAATLRRLAPPLLAAALAARLLLAGAIYGEQAKPDWRAMTAALAAQRPPDELLLVDPWFDQPIFAFYLARDHAGQGEGRLLPLDRWKLEAARAELASLPPGAVLWYAQSGRARVQRDPAALLGETLACPRLTGIVLRQGLLLARYATGGCSAGGS